MNEFINELIAIKWAIEKKKEKFIWDIAEALLNFLNEGVGTAILDDLKFTLDDKSPEWAKLSVYFKFEKEKKM